MGGSSWILRVVCRGSRWILRVVCGGLVLNVSAMIVNCSYDVPILIICLLHYSSLSFLPSLSLPLSHVSVAMTVVLLTGWYSNCYLLNVNQVFLLC